MPASELTADTVQVRLLGPVRLSVADRVLPIRAGLTLTTLAVLAANRGTALSPAQLGKRIWDEPPSTYRAGVQNRIAEIRSALRSAGVSAELLRTDNGCYRLELPADGCDLHRFTNTRARAALAKDAGDHARAAGLFRQALGEWSGAALDGLPPSRFVDNFVAKLDEERGQALSDRIDMDLACGRASEVIGELRVLADNAPTRESVWTRWISALYLCGRTDEAEEACRTIVSRLCGHGLDPTPELRLLQQRILAREPLPAGPRPVRFPAIDADRPTVQETSGAIVLVTAGGHHYEITSPGVTIGRGIGNGIQLPDPKISRSHARIDTDGASARIADLGSSNGVFVNNSRVREPVVIAPGDTIRLGSTVLRVGRAGTVPSGA